MNVYVLSSGSGGDPLSPNHVERWCTLDMALEGSAKRGFRREELVYICAGSLPSVGEIGVEVSEGSDRP